jgi:hypothetical protein
VVEGKVKGEGAQVVAGTERGVGKEEEVEKEEGVAGFL